MTKISHDSETAAHGRQVFTACAFIHQIIDGVPKVFLAKRADTKKFLPGVYELPGGHIDFGEDMIAGLKREIREEFDLDITVGDPFGVFTYTNPIKGSHSIEVIYFASLADPSAPIKVHPEDHSGYGWFGQSELHKAVNGPKGLDDDEFIAIQKGFALLNGQSPNFR